MLTYTFSRREKALIMIFAIILVAIAWFWFVFRGTSDQMASLDGEIATVQSEIDIEQARVAQMNSMSKVVEQRKAEGAKKMIMPTYDNLQPLMAQLNRIMAAADTFTLTFDPLDRENPEYIKRGVRIDYSCGTYKAAEAIVNAIAGGEYPCSIDSVAINDPTVLQKGKSSSGIGWSSTKANDKVSASTHVTFFEKYPEGYVPPADDQSNKTS